MTKRAVWYYSNSKLPTFWHTKRTRFTSKNGVQTNCDSRTVQDTCKYPQVVAHTAWNHALQKGGGAGLGVGGGGE